MTSFFKALDIHISKETKSRNSPVVTAFTPVSLLVHGDDQARNQLGTPGGAESFLREAQIF